MKVEELAWIAGLIDGEGCIYIQTQKSKAGRARYHDLRLTVQMTHRPTIDRLCKLFGKTSRPTHRQPLKQDCRRPWRFTLAGREAAEALRAILPYLVTKAEEANVALKFQEIAGHHKSHVKYSLRDDNLIAQREGFRLKLQELKKLSWDIH